MGHLIVVNKQEQEMESSKIYELGFQHMVSVENLLPSRRECAISYWLTYIIDQMTVPNYRSTLKLTLFLKLSPRLRWKCA